MKIKVIESVMKDNDRIAKANRERMNEAGLVALNITSAPGSGKTTLLKKTMEALGPDQQTLVLVGDLQTTRDAERLAGSAADVVQINTGRGCHLSAAQVSEGIDDLNLVGKSYLFIENVGNMVCPAGFDLGENLRIAMLSVPEGDDKIAKYPTLFQPADLVILNKIDLKDLLDYNLERMQEDLSQVNTRAPLIQLSAKTGQGMDAWLDWLKSKRINCL